MRTSVCVATRNRTDMLHQLLWSLIRQQYTAWDLLIVDDSDEPVPWDRVGVYPRLFSEMKRTGHDVRIAAGPRVGRIGAAFQVGLAASDPVNRLFFRVDDDAWLEPDYLARLVSLMEDPKVGACGGLFLHPGGEPETLAPCDPRYRHAAVGHLSDQVNIQWFRHRSDEPISVEHLTANILFNRKWLERIGGFEAHLYAQHRDETQASWRLHVEGARLLVNPRAVAWHLRGVSGGARGYHPDVYLNDHRTFMAQRRTMKPGTHLHLGHAIGDGLMATPMLDVLRRMNPDRNIAVFAPWAAEVLAGNPAVDEIARHPLDAQRTVRLDQSVYAWASAHGWKGHLAEAYCRMFNLPVPEDLTPRLYLDEPDVGADPCVRPPGRPESLPRSPYVVIAPWSTAKTFDLYGPSGNKDWLADRWAEIVQRISGLTAGMGVPELPSDCLAPDDAGPAMTSASTRPIGIIQIRGSEEEPPIEGVDEIWTGRPLREVFRLIKSAVLVISIDTMAHHAAAAFGVPSVVLWGRSKPGHFGYRKDFIINIQGQCPGLPVERRIAGATVSDRLFDNGGAAGTPAPANPEIAKVIRDRPCINGDQWAMDQESCPIEGHPCMAGITVDQVWDAVKSLVDRENVCPAKDMSAAQPG
ncbi:MAG: glycosyltransferase [Desulfomonile sp.]|nr:glycosyltransferase [Desulfomonile sp.]